MRPQEKRALKWKRVGGLFPWEHQGKSFKPNSAIFYFYLHDGANGPHHERAVKMLKTRIPDTHQKKLFGPAATAAVNE